MKGYRKLIAFLFAVSCATGLAYLGKLDAVYAGLIGSLVAAFFTANVLKRDAVTQSPNVSRP
jgi:hypothetical protein